MQTYSTLDLDDILKRHTASTIAVAHTANQHHHQHHRHGGSGSSKGRLARFIPRCRSCISLACCSSRRRIVFCVCIILSLCALLATVLSLTVFAGPGVAPGDEEVFATFLRKRVHCADMEGSGGVLSFFGGVASNLSRNHVCELSNVVLDTDGDWPLYGGIKPAISIPVSHTAYKDRLLEHIHRREIQQKQQQERQREEERERALRLHVPLATYTHTLNDNNNNNHAQHSAAAFRFMFPYPYSIFGSRFFTVATTAMGEHEEGRRSDLGTVVLYASHYGIRHPVHGLENLGTLIETLDRLLMRHGSSSPHVERVGGVNDQKDPISLPSCRGIADSRSSSSSSGGGTHHNNMRCISQLHHFIIMTKREKFDQKGFVFACLRAALVGAYRRAGRAESEAMAVPISTVRARPFWSSSGVRIERAIVPGALYDLFTNAAQGARFRHDLHRVLSQQGQERVVDPVPSLSHLDGQAASSAARRIVYFRRRSTVRMLVDEDAFIDLLSRAAAEFGAAVSVVTASKMSAVSLHAELSTAQIGIGMHGADLANMLMLGTALGDDEDKKENSNNNNNNVAVIEMNPFMFVEPRFLQICAKLPSCHYLAFNCNGERCAFAGDTKQLHNLLVEAGVRYSRDEQTGREIFHAKKQQALNCSIPASGYLGSASSEHVACWKLLHGTDLIQHLYSTLRSQNMSVMPCNHQREFLNVLVDAMVKVKWIADDSAMSDAVQKKLDAVSVCPRDRRKGAEITKHLRKGFVPLDQRPV